MGIWSTYVILWVSLRMNASWLSHHFTRPFWHEYLSIQSHYVEISRRIKLVCVLAMRVGRGGDTAVVGELISGIWNRWEGVPSVEFGHVVETVFFFSLNHITRMIRTTAHISITVTTQAMIMLIGISSSANIYKSVRGVGNTQRVIKGHKLKKHRQYNDNISEREQVTLWWDDDKGHIALRNGFYIVLSLWINITGINIPFHWDTLPKFLENQNLHLNPNSGYWVYK